MPYTVLCAVCAVCAVLYAACAARAACVLQWSFLYKIVHENPFLAWPRRRGAARLTVPPAFLDPDWKLAAAPLFAAPVSAYFGFDEPFCAMAAFSSSLILCK